MNITRLSGFCKMKAWRSSWMRGTTIWLPFTRRTVAGSLILSASSSTCLTQGEADALRHRQRALASEAEHAVTEMVVEEQTGAYHPCGPQVRFVRQHEFERPDDVRGDLEQRFALGERLGD